MLGAGSAPTLSSLAPAGPARVGTLMPMHDSATRVLDSPLGPLTLEASARGLTAIRFAQPARADRPSPEHRVLLDRGERELGEYLAGDRRAFDVPVDPRGTEFQMRVWRELRRVGFGETISYAELARRLESPRAVRAVGQANGRNPLPIIIPCHRVIATDGSLGGYAGGLDVKRRLLTLERAPEGACSAPPAPPAHTARS